LESYELCNLVENFPNNHRDLEDFKRTLKFAYMYAKTVTLEKHIGQKQIESYFEIEELDVVYLVYNSLLLKED